MEDEHSIDVKPLTQSPKVHRMSFSHESTGIRVSFVLSIITAKRALPQIMTPTKSAESTSTPSKNQQIAILDV